MKKKFNMFHPYLKNYQYPKSVEAKRTVFDEFMNLGGSGCSVAEKNQRGEGINYEDSL